jgi:hypothetical protein
MGKNPGGTDLRAALHDGENNGKPIKSAAARMKTGA